MAEPMETEDLRGRLGLGRVEEEEHGGAGASGNNGAVAEDVRTLWIDYDSHGRRYKDWRKVVEESSEKTFHDSPVDGPSSSLHLMRHWERHRGNPRLWLEGWCRNRGIHHHDRVYHELSVLLEMYFVAGTFDQINVPSLVCFEVAARRVQSVVDAHSADGQKPSWGSAQLFSESGNPDALIAPELRQYVARRAREEAEIEATRQRSRTLSLAVDAGASGGLPRANEWGAGGAVGGKGKGKGERGPAEKRLFPLPRLKQLVGVSSPTRTSASTPSTGCPAPHTGV